MWTRKIMSKSLGPGEIIMHEIRYDYTNDEYILRFLIVKVHVQGTTIWCSLECFKHICSGNSVTAKKLVNSDTTNMTLYKVRFYLAVVSPIITFILCFIFHRLLKSFEMTSYIITIQDQNMMQRRLVLYCTVLHKAKITF